MNKLNSALISSLLVLTIQVNEPKYFNTVFTYSEISLDECGFDSIHKINPHSTKQLYYVDFWASWCAPCVMNLRFFNRLPEKIDTSKVGIIAVSLDENKISYTNTAYKYLDSTYPQFRLDSAKQNCFLKKTIQLKSLPKYIIVDRNGGILNMNAPSPSNPELIEVINLLLKQ
jgi:thiol-disulfide isomerase/thioredoxin